MAQHELPNIVTLLAQRLKGTAVAGHLLTYQDLVFSLIVVFIIVAAFYLASRKITLIPNRIQGACEIFIGGVDDFVCGIIGPKGRKLTPFIGTLFIYILCMNLVGLIPLMKSSTTSWSTTLALAICVFFYVQYSAIRELGFLGYIDHMLGKPRGILAFSLFVPAMMFFLHIITELVRPISLSLRLRSNIWGDDMLLAVFAGFGIGGVPLLIFNSILAVIVSIVQTIVFCLLTTIYFALVLTHEDEREERAALK
jgi:F-type H+-transporting ATPase subunit a